MNKKEFNRKVMENFTTEEVILINPNIYLNREYLKYYQDYNNGEYSTCYRFLQDNRDLLTLEHTPKDEKEKFINVLKNFK